MPGFSKLPFRIWAGRREAPPRLQTAKFCPVREAPANSFAPILLAFATAFQFACTATQAVFRPGKGPAGPFRLRERTRGSFFAAASGPGPHPFLARVRIVSGPRSACVLTRVLCRNGKGPAGPFPERKVARGSFCVRLRPLASGPRSFAEAESGPRVLLRWDATPAPRTNARRASPNCKHAARGCTPCIRTLAARRLHPIWQPTVKKLVGSSMQEIAKIRV
jgi:hypothetical protein